jgi:hypothetical protein
VAIYDASGGTRGYWLRIPRVRTKMPT